MTRVCEARYPKGFSYNTKPGFYMDPFYKKQLDVLIKNIQNDWDFTIIITGGGEVRVGKSVFAMETAAYWVDQLEEKYGIKVPLSLDKNFVLDGKKLIEMGNELGTKHKFSPLIYDEAGADLAGIKVMTQMTQDVLDYYRECGQYNMLNILVLPDFFDLPKALAITRSIFLIDITYFADKDSIFQRGYFKFYSRPNKKKLYIYGKKEMDYQATHPDFKGRFYPFYPIDEVAYRAVKLDALKKRETRRRNLFQLQRDACWYLLNREFNMTQEEIGRRMEQLTGKFIAHNTISDGITHLIGEQE